MTPRLPDAFLHAPIAHRALHGAAGPENSRAAIRAAMAHGYGIEIDLQLSMDGQAMVFHDYDLKRLTGTSGTVQSLAATNLVHRTLSGSDEGIPTLKEILDLVDGQIPLLIEIKDQDGQMGPNVGALEHAAVNDLQGYAGSVALMSFNPYSVACCADLAPDLPRGLVTSAYDPDAWPLPKGTCDRLRDIPDIDASRASFISHEAADLTRPRVTELKGKGINVLCWTVRSPEAEAKARKVAQNVTFEGYLSALPG